MAQIPQVPKLNIDLFKGIQDKPLKLQIEKIAAILKLQKQATNQQQNQQHQQQQQPQTPAPKKRDSNIYRQYESLNNLETQDTLKSQENDSADRPKLRKFYSKHEENQQQQGQQFFAQQQTKKKIQQNQNYMSPNQNNALTPRIVRKNQNVFVHRQRKIISSRNSSNNSSVEQVRNIIQTQRVISYEDNQQNDNFMQSRRHSDKVLLRRPRNIQQPDTSEIKINDQSAIDTSVYYCVGNQQQNRQQGVNQNQKQNQCFSMEVNKNQCEYSLINKGKISENISNINQINSNQQQQSNNLGRRNSKFINQSPQKILKKIPKFQKINNYFLTPGRNYSQERPQNSEFLNSQYDQQQNQPQGNQTEREHTKVTQYQIENQYQLPNYNQRQKKKMHIQRNMKKIVQQRSQIQQQSYYQDNSGISNKPYNINDSQNQEENSFQEIQQLINLGNTNMIKMEKDMNEMNHIIEKMKAKNQNLQKEKQKLNIHM